MSKIKVGLIILNWDGLKDTLECLESVSKSEKPSLDLKVYVVDNASKKPELATLEKAFPDYFYIQNDSNLGFSGGNNVGIKQAFADGCEYVVLLNNDTTVDKDTFEKLVTIAKKEKFNIASPKIYFSKGREFHLSDYKKSELGKVIWYAGGRNDWKNVIPHHIAVDEVDHGQWEKAGETEFATGCCMLIDKDVYKLIGGLDTAYVAYFEDNDYCVKARKKGFSIGFVPQSKMWHKNAGSTGGSGSTKQTGILDKSRFIFTMRYAPLRAKLAIIREKLQGRRNK